MNEQPPFLPGLDMLEKIGAGGMSTVWKAFDHKLGMVVAVKILNDDLTNDPDELELFIAEEKAMEKIDHPGIVRSYELRTCNGVWYYIMEYVDGYNFGTLLQRKQHLQEVDCLLICESVAAALDYAWNDHGVVHCDIKPDNIMINTDGVVKLTDLGLCHTFQYLQDGRQDVPDHVMGTPAYISPEQVYGDVELDCRADIYSLGASIYHLATGRVLFSGFGDEAMLRAHCSDAMRAPDPRVFRPQLTEGFCQLLEAMLVKNREYRISSWQAVCEMCLAIEQGVAFKPRAGTPSSLQLMTDDQQQEMPVQPAVRAGTSTMPKLKPVPKPKQRVLHLFLGGKSKENEPRIQIDPATGKKVIKRRKAVNAGFKIHNPPDW